jgi:hypothetical protein
MKNQAGRLEDNVSRREFTKQSALALLSGVAITIVGCGSDSPTAPTPAPSQPPTSNGPNDVTGSISANHGHTAVITGAQLMAGGTLSLDITGSADHPHTVGLSGADLSQIEDGQQVSKVSTTNVSHNHTVTFN